MRKNSLDEMSRVDLENWVDGLEDTILYIYKHVLEPAPVWFGEYVPPSNYRVIQRVREVLND